MSTNRFDNFGELYRAAFAENNPRDQAIAACGRAEHTESMGGV